MTRERGYLLFTGLVILAAIILFICVIALSPGTSPNEPTSVPLVEKTPPAGPVKENEPAETETPDVTAEVPGDEPPEKTPAGNGKDTPAKKNPAETPRLKQGAEETATIYGVATEKNTGLPISSYRFSIYFSVEDPDEERFVKFVYTDLGGRYSVDIRPGCYRIQVLGERYGNYERYQGESYIEIDGTFKFDFELLSCDPRKATARGCVTDSLTGLPIPGAWVRFTRYGSYDNAYTDANGNYLIRLPALDMRVSAGAAGHYGMNRREEMKFPADEVVEWNIYLDPWPPETAAIEGTVRAEDSGEGVAGAWITVNLNGFEFDFRPRTDAEGNFRQNVPPGEISLFVLGKGFNPEKFPSFEVGPGETKFLEIFMERRPEPVQFTATVLDAETGEPAEGVEVAVSQRFVRETRLSGRTDAEGVFSGKLRPGRDYYIQVFTNNYINHFGDYFAVFPEKDYETVVRLERIRPSNVILYVRAIDADSGEFVEGKIPVNITVNNHYTQYVGVSYGKAAMKEVPSGTIRLTSSNVRYYYVERKFEAVAHKTYNIDLLFRKVPKLNAWLTVITVNKVGRRVKARVEVRDEHGLIEEDLAQRDGPRKLRVPTGTLTVVVSDTYYTAEPVVVRTSKEKPLEVKVRVRPKNE